MVSCAMMLWAAAALGQERYVAAPPSPEAAWLKVAPAEADVVLRVRSVQAGRDDLGKMVKAMSPTFGDQAQQFLDMGIGTFTTRFGKAAAGLPFLVLGRLPKDGDNGPPPFAVIIGAKDYAAVQKQIVGPGGDAKPKPQPGGFDAVTGPNNTPLYTFKGPNFVAFGSSSELVGAIAKPQAATLDAKLAGDVRDRFLAGDLGVYVNLANVQARFGDQIEKFRKSQDARLDEAADKKGQQGQGAEQAKVALDRLLDALKDGDAMAFHIDFAPEGLTVEGVTNVKAGSAAAKKLAGLKAGAGEALGSLPEDASFYVYSNVDPAAFEQLQKMSTPFLSKAGKPSPALEKAMQAQRDAGPRDSTGAVSFTKGGLRAISLVTFDDPKKAAEAAGAAADANKADLPDIVKDIKVEPAAQKYKGFTLASTKVTLDPQKLDALSPNSNGVAKSVLGETISTWSGTDGKRFLSVTAPDWDAAKEQIDTVLGGKGGLGQVSSFKAIRERLPKQVGSIFLVSAQALIRQGLAQYAVAQPDSPAAKVKLDLPKTTAFLGGATTPTAKGVQFKFLLPSDVGPVIEKGILPLINADNKVQQ